MGAAEIKLDLFRKIDTLKEEQLNEAYGMIVNFINQSHTDHWDSLSKEEKLAIEEGIAQIEGGKTKPYEEVMTSLRQKYRI